MTAHHGPMRRLLLVVNPKAQGVTPRSSEAVEQALERAFEVRIVHTRGRGHAQELTAGGIRDGADLVVTYGGDGTVNEMLNAVAGTDTPVSVVPGGGANVFARAIGLPWDAADAAAYLAATDRDAKRFSLGMVDGRWFASSCGMGFDAAIVKAVERHPSVKRAIGDWFFVWTGLRLFFLHGYDRRRPRIRMSTGSDPERWRGGLYLVIVQNLDPFTYLGKRPLRINPRVRLESGLDAFGVTSMRSRRILPILLEAFSSASHLSAPDVVSVHDERSVWLRADVPLPTQADGEYLGDRQEIQIELVPDAVRVLC
jgi:diacylglycerol kinase family enzyme